jgi:hypothetical protein
VAAIVPRSYGVALAGVAGKLGLNRIPVLPADHQRELVL